MSDWTKDTGKPGCCRGCAKRKPGCHNVRTCPDWAQEVERRRKEKEAREAQGPVTRKSWEERKRAWR